MKAAPRLTPLRALELMRIADRRASRVRALTPSDSAAIAADLERVANELADHVRAGLSAKRRRRRKR